MPGKCKFQDSWLSKGIYKDWLVKEIQDIHFARCMACSKSIKLQTMGEAALTSHAGGAGHKAAVRKLREDNVMLINAAGQINGSVKQTEDSKEQVAICFKRETLDRITSSDLSNLPHSPTTNSISHNAERKEHSGAPDSAPAGTSQVVSQRLDPAGAEADGATRRSSPPHDPSDPSRREHQHTADALEQQMKILEWENRMKVLVREKTRAARQKGKAFRMKKSYYKAKLKRMGEDVPPSSSSSNGSDDEAKTCGQSA